MQVGLEIFDEHGAKILDMSRSAFRIVKVVNFEEYKRLQLDSRTQFALISSFIDIDKVKDKKHLSIGDDVFEQWLELAESILILEHNHVKR